MELWMSSRKPFLEDTNFVNRFRELIRGKKQIKEILKVQRYATIPPIAELLDKKITRNRMQRDKLVFEIYTQYGYAMK